MISSIPSSLESTVAKVGTGAAIGAAAHQQISSSQNQDTKIRQENRLHLNEKRITPLQFTKTAREAHQSIPSIESDLRDKDCLSDKQCLIARGFPWDEVIEIKDKEKTPKESPLLSISIGQLSHNTILETCEVPSESHNTSGSLTSQEKLNVNSETRYGCGVLETGTSIRCSSSLSAPAQVAALAGLFLAAYVFVFPLARKGKQIVEKYLKL